LTANTHFLEIHNHAKVIQGQKTESNLMDIQ